MRIAMIGSRGLLSRYSGVETLLAELCPRLVQNGHQVTVFGSRTDTDTLCGVNCERAPALKSKYLETPTAALFSTRRAILRRYDLIHFHDVAAGVFAPIATAQRVPSVMTLHSLDWKREKWPTLAQNAIRKVESVAVRAAGRITVVSKSLQGYLERTYALPSTLLPNTVAPLPYVQPSSFSAHLGLTPFRYILFAARLVKEKAPLDLIQAFKRLDTDFKLVIAGESCYDDRYLQDLYDCARGHNVIFTGQVSFENLSELYSNASVFVLPSRVEGRSMSILEAMAHGTPILASDIAENVELISKGDSTFRSGDISDLAAKLTTIIDRPDAITVRQTRCRDDLEGMPSWSLIVEGYERVYCHALY